MKLKTISGFSIFIFLNGCSWMIPQSAYKQVSKEIFADIDKNNNAFITKDELYEALKDDEESIENAKKENISMKAYVKKELSKVDINQDNKVDFSEFFRMIKLKNDL